MFFFLEFFSIGILFIFSFILSLIIIVLAFNVGYSLEGTEKTDSYECGFDPYEDSRTLFDIHFYLIAILFIVFDLEALYIFPWCVSLSSISIDGFFCMLDFIIELLVGYFYIWNIGALDWE